MWASASSLSRARGTTAWVELDPMRRRRSRVLRAVRSPCESEAAPEQFLVDAERRELLLAPGAQDVLLNVYSLNAEAAPANELLAFSTGPVALGGAFHVGVELGGCEWYYGVGGVSTCPPRCAAGHVYECTIHLGRARLRPEELADLLHGLAQEWLGEDYCVVERNCCAFARALCAELGVGEVPAWVDRFARLLWNGCEAGRGLRRLPAAVWTVGAALQGLLGAGRA